MPQELRDNALRVLRFADWSDFREHWSHAAASDHVFRGQRDPSWKLASQWERKIEWMQGHLRRDQRVESFFIGETYKANRDHYLKHFKEQVRPLPDSVVPSLRSDSHWWAFGRHHGLISPLLDWTRRPLVAAFFAFIDFAEWILDDGASTQELDTRRHKVTHVAVWALDCSKGACRTGEFDLIDGQPGFEGRQKAQDGVFTLLSDGRHFDVQSYLADRGLLDALCRYEVPVRGATALKELHDEGIHYAALFPDYSGAAMYANTREFVKPESLSELLEAE